MSLKDNLQWIPWQRYVLLLTVNNLKTINLGRFRLKISADNIANRLRMYKAYQTEVIDTKKK